MIKNIVLVDLDHTLSDASWRDPLIAAGDWDAYHSEFVKDLPCHDIICMINSLAICGFHIVAVTARPEKWRKATMEWLYRHGVKVHHILMRADDCYSSAVELKLELAKDILDSVVFVLDDREDVVAAFAGKNITALQVKGRKYS
jgi:hypothetical protein